MIKSQLGEVHLTTPDYQLCDILNVTRADVDRVVEIGLRADLVSILGALVEEYGTNKAMDMWADAVKSYIDVISQ